MQWVIRLFWCEDEICWKYAWNSREAKINFMGIPTRYFYETAGTYVLSQLEAGELLRTVDVVAKGLNQTELALRN